MFAEPGWCGVCGLPVPAGDRFCRWPFGARAGDGQPDGEVVPWAPQSLAFMTELAGLQHWRCPWCGDCLPDSPRGTAIDHIVPRVYGGPHRRWNLQLLHQECNSAKGKKITAGALELADAHGVTISTPIESTFVTVRHRTKITKGPGSRAAGLAMAFKLIESARDRWRAVSAPHLVALVRTGAVFVNGKLVERPGGDAPPEAA